MNKVKGYRVMCGYSQSDLAKRLNISTRTYIEREKDGKFNIAEANAILQAFREKDPNITYEQIFLD